MHTSQSQPKENINLVNPIQSEKEPWLSTKKVFSFMKNHSRWLQKLWTTLPNNGMQKDAKTNKVTLSAYPTMATLTSLLSLLDLSALPLLKLKKKKELKLLSF